MIPTIKDLLTEKKFHSPLKNQVALFVLLFLPIALVFAISYYYMSNSLTKLTETTFQQLAIQSSISLDRKLTGLTTIGEDFTDNAKFRKAVNAGNWKEASQIVAIFQETNDNQYIDMVALVDAKGTVRSLSPAAPEFIGKDFSYRDWYTGTMATGQPYISEVFKRAKVPQNNVVAVSMPIVGDNQKIIAMLVFQVSLDHFSSLVEKIPVGNNGFVVAVDQKGQVVASPQYLPQGDIVSLANLSSVKEVLAGNTGVTEVYVPEKKKTFLIAYQPTQHRWGVLVEQPKSDAFAERRFIRAAILAIFLAVLAINIFRIRIIKKIVNQCNP
jgi:C4-dicarboxylate-specific signal transduction histidine kinase